jgi:hypothetical protein
MLGFLLRLWLTRFSPRTIGNAVAFCVGSLLMILARSTWFGPTILLMAFSALLAWCAAWRVLTGFWPGDEPESDG